MITPCHNAAPFIAETIDSVASQTYRPIEHIVVDDASTDGSWDVIRSYGDSIDAVLLDRNSGGSHARNVGFVRSRGEYIVFLDSDDVLAADAIEALVETTRSHPESIVYCPWKRLRQIDGEWRGVAGEVPFPEPGSDFLRGWLEGIWVPPCAVMWPRALYESTGGWDEEISFNDDADLMMRTLATGVELVRADRGEAYYRAMGQFGSSLSHGVFTERRSRSNVRVLVKLAEQLRKMGRLPEYADRITFLLQSEGTRAYMESYPELGQEYVALARRYGRPAKLAPTGAGHVITKLIGVDGKERIARALARMGIMTPARRKVLEYRRQWTAANTRVAETAGGGGATADHGPGERERG